MWESRHVSGRNRNILLLASCNQGSVLAECTLGQVERLRYSPYGNLQGQNPRPYRPGFNGELREPQGWYPLGNGHRIYNPVLRRFHSPDRLSPFGKGGLNAYAYCLGDPVNATDPTGQFTDFGDFLKGVLFDNPTANFALSFGLLSLNLVSAFITTPVTTAAQVAYYSGVGGAVTGMTGASVQFVGERDVGRWISIVGTVISGVSVATKVGIALKNLKDKWPEYMENWRDRVMGMIAPWRAGKLTTRPATPLSEMAHRLDDLAVPGSSSGRVAMVSYRKTPTPPPSIGRSTGSVRSTSSSVTSDVTRLRRSNAFRRRKKLEETEF